MVKQVIVVRKDLNMRKGKMVAQGAHAAMGFICEQLIKRLHNKEPLLINLTDDEISWMFSGRTKIVLGVKSEQELQELISKAKEKNITTIPIVDAGRTEFNNVPTLTSAAFGPNEVELIDSITGHLDLI